MRTVRVFITNLGRYVEGCLIGEWVRLPISKDKLSTVLQSIGIDKSNSEFFITDYEMLFSNVTISEYASIEELNELAIQLEALTDADFDKLAAIMECEYSLSVSEILQIMNQLDEFDLIPDIEDDEGLGLYFAEECGTFNAIPEHLKAYINYEAYGRDIRLESNCMYTSSGFLLDNR